MKKRDCPFTVGLPIYCTNKTCDGCQVRIDHEDRRAHEVYEAWKELERNKNSGAYPSPSDD